MPVRLTNLTLPVEEPETGLLRVIAERLEVSDDEIRSWRILRKSLDARSRKRLKFVYSISAELSDSLTARLLAEDSEDLQAYVARPFEELPLGKTSLDERPVVVGSGPAGLLAAYYLALKGYHPIVIDRGQAVKSRVRAVREFDRGGVHDADNNYLFGEGGAGCFSDGKLTCRISGADVDWVLDRFVDCGGRESLVYEHRPHLGSNALPMICRNFRRKIEQLGGEYRFGCCLEKLDIRDGKICGAMTSNGYLATSQLFLGIGHSARDTYQMLYDIGVPMAAKAFQFGLRIEQPQDVVNRHAYGDDRYLELLGAASYTLTARGRHDSRDLFTFCMCAGGVVIPSISEPGMFCSNGMSNSRHDTPFANSGLVTTLEPHEFGSGHPLAGVELQRRYESAAFKLAGGNYFCPIQSAKDFLAGRSPSSKMSLPSSYRRGTKPVNLEGLLPPSITRSLRAGLPIMDQKWKGDFLKDAVLVGPEMRGSSPVRIERDRITRQCPGIDGLYPIGEGAGYAGGIVTAAVDGLRSAKQLAAVFSPITQ